MLIKKKEKGDVFMDKIFGYIKSGPPILIAVIVFVIGLIALMIVSKIIKKALSKTKLDVSLQSFFVKTFNIVVIILLLICSLSTAGISTTGLIAGFSAAGAAVALALKDSLGNLAGGIVLLITHPFVTGDFIEMGDKSGVVEQIDILQTTLITPDNKTVVIPNGLLSSDEVVNYTKQKTRRVDLTIPISYDNDVEEAKKSVLKATTRESKVLHSPNAPFVRVGEYSDSCVNLTVRVWCNTEDYWDVYFSMIEKVRDAFNEDNITIPYQRIDIHMVDEK